MPYKAFTINGVGNVTIYKRKTNRSIRLTVEADGGVRVTMPMWVPYHAGVAFASARRTWILTQSQRQSSGGLLKPGQKIGKAHHLAFHCDPLTAKVKTNIRTSEIIVTYGIGQSITQSEVQDAARAASIRALRTEAEKLLIARLKQLAEINGIPFRNASVKRLKTRWGSCDQHTNIVLNVFLVQLPWELIDYVIMHELTHTRVLHHGPDFWSALETLCPDARKMRKSMGLYRPALLVA